MKKKVLLRQFQISWIPLLVAIIYASIAYYSAKESQRSIMTFVNYFSGTFFFLMWIVGQYLRTSKEINDTSNYTNLQTGLADIQKAISNLNEDEKREKVKSEIKRNEIAELIESQSQSVPAQEEVSNYIDVEDRVIAAFKKYTSVNFEINDNVRLNNRYEIDLLLRANGREFSDRIIEITYAKKILSFEMIKLGVAHLDKSSQFYSKTFGRKVVPILFIVFSSKTKATEQALRNLSQRARNEANDYASLDRFNIFFVEESKIEDFDIKALLKW